MIWLMVGNTNFLADVKIDVDVDAVTTLFATPLSAKATLFFKAASLCDVGADAAAVTAVAVTDRARFLSALPRRFCPGAMIRFVDVSAASLSSLDDDDASLDDTSSRPRFMFMLELSELVIASLIVFCFFEA